MFAVICVLFGYAFLRAFPVWEYPLGGALIVLGLFAASIILLKVKGQKVGALAICVGGLGAMLAFSMVFTANGILQTLAFLTALTAVGYFIYAGSGNAIMSGFCDFLAVDIIKAVFVMPFYSPLSLIHALFSGKRINVRLLAKAALGVMVAVIPTSVVIGLLSYDSAFTGLIADIFSLKDIFSHIFSFIFGIPIGMYVFALAHSAQNGCGREKITLEECERVGRALRMVPSATVLGAVVPMLLVYVIFFIAQWKYYLSAFSGVLPESISYADYAREGFFQLCAVAVINLLMLICVSVFMKRRGILQRVLNVIICVFTLILIATAISKMVLYIDRFALTQKRVYATWFMAVMALIFILLIVKQAAVRLPSLAISLAVFVISFMLLTFSSPEALIANYNVDRYIDGNSEHIDVDGLTDLGDSAVPALMRLAAFEDEKNGTDITADHFYDDPYICEDDRYAELYTFYNHYKEYGKDSVFSFTVPYLRAKSVINNQSSPDKGELFL